MNLTSPQPQVSKTSESNSRLYPRPKPESAFVEIMNQVVGVYNIIMQLIRQ